MLIIFCSIDEEKICRCMAGCSRYFCYLINSNLVSCLWLLPIHLQTMLVSIPYRYRSDINGDIDIKNLVIREALWQ